MENYLYFGQGDGANATSEAVVYPASSFRGADVASGAIALYFKPLKLGDAVAAGDVNDAVVLTITDGTQKAVIKVIMEHIAGATGVHQVPFVVIADEDNGVFVHSGITAVETALAA
tara:strand:+ start:298 stop:645 length:348 start_codon:yes stop_codon:yes gene_type:complete